MTIKVLQEFRDKANYSIVYEVGQIVDFEDARAENIISRGLGEAVHAKVEETSEAKEEEAVKEPVKRKRKVND